MLVDLAPSQIELSITTSFKRCMWIKIYKIDLDTIQGESKGLNTNRSSKLY